MTSHFFDFEQGVKDVATRITDLQDLVAAGAENLPEKNPEEEIARLQVKQARLLRVIYRQLTPHQKVQVARHAERPHTSDYIDAYITQFTPLAGDRLFGEDKALTAGFGRFEGQPIAILGTEKGHNTKARVEHNFGMPRPDGYRKAQRIMELANRFNLPILTFIDTPGAYPGVDAESRGQSEAIARCIETSLQIDVPIIATITGEGGSGGALALATADKILMLEHSVYSVISPEGCASILWREANKDTIPMAADALQLTAQQMMNRKIIDGIIREPVGGAHRNKALTFKRVGEEITAVLKSVEADGTDRNARRQRFLKIG